MSIIHTFDPDSEEIVQVKLCGLFKRQNTFAIFIQGCQIVNKPDKISVANGDFKPPPWWQQRRRLGNHGFQLDHFVNVFISQHRETVLVELHRLGHALFNPGMKGCPQNQGVGGVGVRDRV